MILEQENRRGANHITYNQDKNKKTSQMVVLFDNFLS